MLSTGVDLDHRMIEKLKAEEVSKKFLDEEGRRRFNAVECNFTEVAGKLTRKDCLPDFVENNNKLKPKFDIFLADLGYNVDQYATVAGLSYMKPEDRLDMRYSRSSTSPSAVDIVSNRDF